MPLESLYNKLFILREEKETSTLATVVVFLTLVRLENLEAIVVGVERLCNFCFIDTVYMSNVFEYLWAVRVYMNIDLSGLEEIILLANLINTVDANVSCYSLSFGQ